MKDWGDFDSFASGHTSVLEGRHDDCNTEESPWLEVTRVLLGLVRSPGVTDFTIFFHPAQKSFCLALFLLFKVHGLFIIESKYQNHQETQRELCIVSSFPTALADPSTAALDCWKVIVVPAGKPSTPPKGTAAPPLVGQCP